MSNHSAYKYSVTIHTDDLAVVNCLRALSQFSQKTGVNRIPWGNTKDSDWRRAGNTVTFHFTSAKYRDGFLSEARRLLPNGLWSEERRSDNDPARPARQANRALLNKPLQLTAAGGGVPGGQPSGGRSGVRLASALRSVVTCGTRGRS